MAKEFLPLFLDFNETTQDLSDEQCGRLVRALVSYANGGQEYSLQGMELMAFRFLKGSIDRNRRLSAVRAEAGSKGGFAKAEKQTMANDSKSWQAVANDSKNTNINNDINSKTNNDINNDSLMDDDEAQAIQLEQNRVLDAAEDAGFQKSNSVRAHLIRLFAEYGLDRMLDGISSCVTHGAPNLAYLQAVLRGKSESGERDYAQLQKDTLERQRQRIIKKMNADNFQQRDYSGVDAEIMSDLAKDMTDFLAKGAG